LAITNPACSAVSLR